MTKETGLSSRNGVVIGSPEWQAEQNKRREEKFSVLFWKYVEPSKTTSEEKDLVLFLMEQAAEQELAAVRSEQRTLEGALLTEPQRKELIHAAELALADAYQGNRSVLERAIEKLHTLSSERNEP